ncbi:hypothetical protein QJS10_CPB13g01166 [Acorus calamus]|uniref:Uncharacterized protein n=1 Tax=Acorus calamus TaxID=4465 RepID=A0AAV9DM65_ACOCL|nr:hypothetical protein QJS10_CPB13g01166 [Acorus calamus]
MDTRITNVPNAQFDALLFVQLIGTRGIQLEYFSAHLEKFGEPCDYESLFDYDGYKKQILSYEIYNMLLQDLFKSTLDQQE